MLWMCSVKVCNNILQLLFSFSASITKKFLAKMTIAASIWSQKKKKKKRKANCTAQGAFVWGASGKKSSRATLAPRQAGCRGYRDIILLLAVHLRVGSKLDSFICHAPARSEISWHQITSQDQTERTSWNMTQHTLWQPHFAPHHLITNLFNLRNPGPNGSFATWKKYKKGKIYPGCKPA